MGLKNGWGKFQGKWGRGWNWVFESFLRKHIFSVNRVYLREKDLLPWRIIHYHQNRNRLIQLGSNFAVLVNQLKNHDQMLFPRFNSGSILTDLTCLNRFEPVLNDFVRLSGVRWVWKGSISFAGANRISFFDDLISANLILNWVRDGPHGQFRPKMTEKIQNYLKLFDFHFEIL